MKTLFNLRDYVDNEELPHVSLEYNEKQGAEEKYCVRRGPETISVFTQGTALDITYIIVKSYKQLLASYYDQFDGFNAALDELMRMASERTDDNEQVQ